MKKFLLTIFLSVLCIMPTFAGTTVTAEEIGKILDKYYATQATGKVNSNLQMQNQILAVLNKNLSFNDTIIEMCGIMKLDEQTCVKFANDLWNLSYPQDLTTRTKNQQESEQFCTPDGDCFTNKKPNSTEIDIKHDYTYKNDSMDINKAMDVAIQDSGFPNCEIQEDNLIYCFDKDRAEFFHFKQIIADNKN